MNKSCHWHCKIPRAKY